MLWLILWFNFWQIFFHSSLLLDFSLATFSFTFCYFRIIFGNFFSYLPFSNYFGDFSLTFCSFRVFLSLPQFYDRPLWSSRRWHRTWKQIRGSLKNDRIQWGSEYQISLVFKWLKRGQIPNGPVLECHLNIGQPNHLNTRRMGAKTLLATLLASSTNFLWEQAWSGKQIAV